MTASILASVVDISKPWAVREYQDHTVGLLQRRSTRRILVNHQRIRYDEDPKGILSPGRWHDPVCEPDPTNARHGCDVRRPGNPPPLVWGTTLPPMAVVFDLDSSDWPTIRDFARKTIAWATARAIEVEVGYTGSKLHLILYIDPDSYVVPFTATEEVGRLVDVARVVRETVYSAIVRDARLDVVAAQADRLKVSWSSASYGTILRTYGAAKPDGRVKTFLYEVPEERPDPAPPLRFPLRLPKPFSIAPWKAEVDAALQAASDAIEARQSAPPSPPASLSETETRWWWPHALAPPASAHEEAMRVVVPLLRETGLSENDAVSWMVANWRPGGECGSPSHRPGTRAFEASVRGLYSRTIEGRPRAPAYRLFLAKLGQLGLKPAAEEHRLVVNPATLAYFDPHQNRSLRLVVDAALAELFADVEDP